MEGARDQLGQALGVIDFHDPLGHGAEDCAVIELLKRFAIEHAAGDLADKDDEWCGVQMRDVDAGRGIGRTRAAGDETDAGLAGELALGLGHHRCAAFLAADGDLDLGVMQRIECGEVAFARHAEKLLHTVHDQLVHKHLSSGAWLGRGVRLCGCLHGVCSLLYGGVMNEVIRASRTHSESRRAKGLPARLPTKIE